MMKAIRTIGEAYQEKKTVKQENSKKSILKCVEFGSAKKYKFHRWEIFILAAAESGVKVVYVCRIGENVVGPSGKR